MRYLRSAAVVVLSVACVLSMRAENKFVGSKACGMCHKSGKGGTSYAVWEKTAHAKAYQVLLSDNAKKIAKEKGLKVAANEAPECLKCHVTGGGVAKNVDASFKKEEGVGCEMCHGAGSAYKMVHMGGDKAKAKTAGMVTPAKDEKLCVTCHNSDSPTFKDFKFEEMWAKIDHSKKK
ncbi:MAG: cytochrome C554 [Ignavibacteriae bacterium]|nr:cytochrome C554 [Ignavibacteriota bacterium]